MCNLYSIDIGQQAIRDIAKAMRDVTGNMPSLPGVFPDYFAPIVRNAQDGVRELTMARWGMPSPAFAIGGKKTDTGAQIEQWMSAPIGDALALQLPLPDDALRIVARGHKADPRTAA